MSISVHFPEMSSALYVSRYSTNRNIMTLQMRIDQIFDDVVAQEQSITHLRDHENLNAQEEFGLHLGLETLDSLLSELKSLSESKENLLLDLDLDSAMDEIIKMDIFISKFRSPQGQKYSDSLNRYLSDEDQNFFCIHKRHLSIQELQQRILHFSISN